MFSIHKNNVVFRNKKKTHLPMQIEPPCKPHATALRKEHHSVGNLRLPRRNFHTDLWTNMAFHDLKKMKLSIAYHIFRLLSIISPTAKIRLNISVLARSANEFLRIGPLHLSACPSADTSTVAKALDVDRGRYVASFKLGIVHEEDFLRNCRQSHGTGHRTRS